MHIAVFRGTAPEDAVKDRSIPIDVTTLCELHAVICHFVPFQLCHSLFGRSFVPFGDDQRQQPVGGDATTVR